MPRKNETNPYKVVATFELTPGRADEEISRIDRDDSLLNTLREQPGFRSYEVMKTSEDSTMTLQTWESAEYFTQAMETAQANRAPPDREDIVLDREWYAGEVVLTSEQDSNVSTEDTMTHSSTHDTNEPTILVTGATGTIGSELIRQLATTDTDVLALTRDPENAAWMKEFDVDIVEGDFRDTTSLDVALDSVDSVFLLSGIDRDQVALQGNVVETAQRADIQHLVKLSSAGAGPESPETIAQWHGETEQQIEDSGLSYTHLQPVYYMQNLLGFAESIRRDGAFYQAIPRDATVSMIDTRDIASVATTVLTEDGHENETYLLTGPEALTYEQVADTLSTVTETEVTYVEIPPEDLKKGMIERGQPEWLADTFVDLQASFGEGDGDTVTDTVAAVTGNPPRSFEDFATDHAEHFRAQGADA